MNVTPDLAILSSYVGAVVLGALPVLALVVLCVTLWRYVSNGRG